MDKITTYEFLQGTTKFYGVFPQDMEKAFGNILARHGFQYTPTWKPQTAEWFDFTERLYSSVGVTVALKFRPDYLTSLHDVSGINADDDKVTAKAVRTGNFTTEIAVGMNFNTVSDAVVAIDLLQRITAAAAEMEIAFRRINALINL